MNDHLARLEKLAREWPPQKTWGLNDRDRADLRWAVEAIGRLEGVCVRLDEFQEYFDEHTWGQGMPGNEFYRPWLMSIVADTREALEMTGCRGEAG